MRNPKKQTPSFTVGSYYYAVILKDGLYETIHCNLKAVIVEEDQRKFILDGRTDSPKGVDVKTLYYSRDEAEKAKRALNYGQMKEVVRTNLKLAQKNAEFILKLQRALCQPTCG